MFRELPLLYNNEKEKYRAAPYPPKDTGNYWRGRRDAKKVAESQISSLLRVAW